MLNKNVLLLLASSFLTFSGMQAMEAWGLDEPQQGITHVFNDDDLITI